MLVRNFPPAYVLVVLVTVSLFFFLSYTYGASRVQQLVPQSPQHEKPNPAPEKPSPKFDEPKPADRPSPLDVHFEWEARKEDYPVPKESLIPLPKGSNGTSASIPTIQHVFEPSTDEDYNNKIRDRRNVVKGAMERCWKGYKKFAWLKDALAPESAKGRDHSGGWAATLVASLDTLWIMELVPEFEEAVAALKEIDFTFTGDTEINTFETTIRNLGGLLAAHDLTEDKYPILLEKAIELGDMLYASFDTPNRMPITRWEWRSARDGNKQEASDGVLLAELSSFSLEFTRLSQITGNPKYYDAIQRVSDEFENQQNSTKLPGMWPAVVNAKDLNFAGDNSFALSSMADSTYEYLPKQYLLLGGQSQQPRKMYEHAIETAKSNLFYRPMTKDKNDILLSGLVHVSSPTEIKLDPEGQHLSCYIGGMMGIASQVFDRKDDLPIARKLLDGCLWAYDSTQTGIMPEIFHTIPCENNTECEWDNQKWLDDVMKRHKEQGVNEENVDWKVLEYRLNPGFADIPDRRYILRPETIESLFTLYRITGSEDLRDRAWTLFDNLEKVTKTRFGNAAVDDVTTGPFPEHADSMESSWMAETLKYFYLVFCDQRIVSLDEWVFNTEAHPLRWKGVEKGKVVEGQEEGEGGF